jgi:hypothetical protein
VRGRPRHICLPHIYKSALLALLGWFALQQGAGAAEGILAFHSDIVVYRDGTLEVRETIRVRAEGREIRRGIVRDFPTTYPTRDGRQIVVGFAFQSATRDGRPEAWRVEDLQNGKRIYLGSASYLLPRGEYTYEIVYRTDRQMGFFSDHDELYWNVTGVGSDFTIERASATVHLPGDIPRDAIKLEGYTGPQGARGGNLTAQLKDGVPHYFTTRRLGPREGLTIVATWPKGYIQPTVETPAPMPSRTASPGYDLSRDSGQAPDFSGLSPAERVFKRVLPRSNLPLWIALSGFLGLLAYYWIMWNRVGRDPPGSVIIPQYEPPKGLSPAAMRYILRMGDDNECFGAAVLDLAVKGYLRIQEESGILGLGKTFTLIKQPTPAGRILAADELALLKELFSAGDSLVLKQENHRVMRRARRQHSASLERQYSSGYFRLNSGWHFLGLLISLVVLLSLALPGNSEWWPRWFLASPLGWLTVLLAIGAIVLNIVFGRLLKAPTLEGRTAMDHIRGFRMYLEVAEGEELRRVAAPPPPLTPQLYEAYLPAALALDVEQKWAERFAAVLDIRAPDYQPAWYSGPGFSARNLGAFTSGLGSSLNSAIAASSTAPGSKSGSGGGGVSGGGGGGGRVGGW